MPILINPSSVQGNSQNTDAYENNYEDSNSVREIKTRTDQTSEPEVNQPALCISNIRTIRNDIDFDRWICLE